MDGKEIGGLKELIHEAIAPLEKRLGELPTREEVREIVNDAFDRLAASTQNEFRSINQRIDMLDSRIAKLEDRVGLILRRLDNIDTSLVDLRVSNREVVNKNGLLRERLEQLEARVALLEAAQNGSD